MYQCHSRERPEGKHLRSLEAFPERIGSYRPDELILWSYLVLQDWTGRHGVLSLLSITTQATCISVQWYWQMGYKKTGSLWRGVVVVFRSCCCFPRGLYLSSTQLQIQVCHINMMTSSNGNIFRITGPLWGKPPVTGGSHHKGQWRGTLMFSLICAWTNDWANTPDAGDLRRNRAHYDVTVMNWDKMAAFLQTIFLDEFLEW